MYGVKFKSSFKEITSIAEIELVTQINLPCRTGRQLYRENHLTNDPITYYRQSVYIPLIENILEDLEARFPEETIQLYNFSILFPDSNFHSLKSKQNIQALANKYSTFFNEPEELVAQNIRLELECWTTSDWRKKMVLADECNSPYKVLQSSSLSIFTQKNDTSGRNGILF